MKKQNILMAYILIGMGIYLLMKQVDVPFFSDFYEWPTTLMIIGAVLFIHSARTKDVPYIFMGVIVLGIGIHFHGLYNYAFWNNHWAVYIFIIGLAFMIRSIWTKEGIMTGIVLTIIASIFIFSLSLPQWLTSPFQLLKHIQTFWPITIIILGIYILRRK